MISLDEYFDEYRRLAFDQAIHGPMEEFVKLAAGVRDAGRKLIFAGNGASASLASHGANDFTKQGKVRATTFHDPSLITCFANDYGYDYWLAEALKHYADSGDSVVLISVSGESPSVVNAARYAQSQKMPVISFTGRSPHNSLAGLSDIGFHVPSDAYNIVECIHSIWVTAAIDFLIGSAVYETRATTTGA